MRFPGGVTVTLITRTISGQNAQGNDVFTTTSTSIPNCAFDPGTSIEILNGRDTVITQPTVYLPSEAQSVFPIDAVTVNGTTYEVDASPNYNVNPFTGWQPGIVVKLKQVTG